MQLGVPIGNQSQGKHFQVLPFLLTTLRSIRNLKNIFLIMWHKHLIKQKIKSVRLDLDIASPFLDSKEVKKLDKLHEDLHFALWSARPFSKVKIP